MGSWKYSDAQSYDIPDGIHIARIVELTPNAVSTAGNMMWKFRLAIRNYARSVHMFITLNKPWTDTQKARAGSCFSVAEGSDNPDDWVGHDGVVELMHTKSADGKIYLNVSKLYSREEGRKKLFEQKQKQEAENFFAGDTPLAAEDAHISPQSTNSRGWTPDEGEPFDVNKGF